MTTSANVPKSDNGISVEIAFFVRFIENYAREHECTREDLERLIDKLLPVIETYLRYEDLPAIAESLKEPQLSCTQNAAEPHSTKESN